MTFRTGTGAIALGVAASLATAAPALAQTAQAPAPVGQELSWSSAAQRIGAFTPRALATRGTGVTIAVIDSGIRADHREFQGAIAGGFNAFTGATGVAAATDTNGHGTHVASIAAARINNTGMAGVASNARILPVRVFTGSSTTDAVVNRGIAWSTSQRAFVVNMSLGGSVASPTMRDTMRAGVTAGQLFVVAAGNEGQANPAFPGRFALESWARGQIIVVGAVDAQNGIATFSNRAGDARNFFLVAPGTGIVGAYHTSPAAYVSMSGTSMAAPAVAGAAAVVKGAWPHLSAQQVASILFTTATDLGAPGVDAVYGRGLVNLARALQPVGPVRASGTAGMTTLGATVTVAGGATFGPMAAASASGAMDGVVFDGFGRDFGYDFAWRSAFARPSAAALAGDGLAVRMGNRRSGADSPRGRLTLKSDPAPGAPDRWTVLARFDGTDGSGWAVGAGDAAQLAGASAVVQGPAAGLLPGPVSGPDSDFLSGSVPGALAPLVQGDAVGAAVWRTTDSQVRFGLSAQVEDRTVHHITTERGPQARTGAARATATLAWQSGPVHLSTAVSAIREPSGRLGTVEAPELAVAGTAATLAVEAGAVWQAAPDTALVASVAAGTTAPQAGARGSLIQRVSRTGTSAWSVGVVRSGVLRPGDRLDVMVASPLTARSGAMDLRLATAADPQTGTPLLADRRVSLRAQTPEQRLDVSYLAPMGRDGQIGVALLSRRHADGVAGRDETAAAIRLSTRF